MDKVRLCRMSPTVLTEPQMVPIIIRGLLNQSHAGPLMTNVPQTIDGLLTELRRLEGISNSFLNNLQKDPVPTVDNPIQPVNDEVLKAVGILSNQLSALNYKVQGMGQPPRYPPPFTQPPPSMVANPRQVRFAQVPFAPRPASPQTMCFNCQRFGHYARNCPIPLVQENFKADPSGQDRQ